MALLSLHIHEENLCEKFCDFNIMRVFRIFLVEISLAHLFCWSFNWQANIYFDVIRQIQGLSLLFGDRRSIEENK